jgi:hypothetical protein
VFAWHGCWLGPIRPAVCFWHVAYPHFSVIHLVMDNAVHGTQRNVWAVCQFNASSVLRACARLTLSCVVDMRRHPGCCLSSASVLPLSKALHHIRTYFGDIAHTPYTCTY